MISEITETDRKEYDALECKNISLEKFVMIRRDEQMRMARVSKQYDDLDTTKGGFESIKSLKYERNNAVRRTIVLDGANIMHCGSTHIDTREGGSRSIPDVAALLAVMRFFTVRGFEVFAVISRKYVKPNATSFKEGIDTLIKNHLCVVVPHTNLDDSVALEFASQINGVVLTTDQFRDHANMDRRLERIVRVNRLGINWESINSNYRHRRETNREKDYWPGKKMFFMNDNKRMTDEEVIKRLYCFPEDLQYGISKERRELAYSEEKQKKVISILEDLIVIGKFQYERNIDQILKSPVHVPQEPTRRSYSDYEDMPIDEVPVDSQASYIDFYPEDDSDSE
uniref:RNase_Zc3h12a domain-containing protein n=1 Tax=Caenorhabditis tropicalis TaxID=1561998 RepID=A0A1I7V081_9PELO